MVNYSYADIFILNALSRLLGYTFIIPDYGIEIFLLALYRGTNEKRKATRGGVRPWNRWKRRCGRGVYRCDL